MDEDTFKGDTRTTWGQLTDYDLPVMEGTKEGLADFLQKRSRYEKGMDEKILRTDLMAATASMSY